MRTLSTYRVAALSFVVFSGLAFSIWDHLSTPGKAGSSDPRDEKMLAMNMGAFNPEGTSQSDDPDDEPDVIYVNAPMTAKAARTWLLLQSEIDMSFPQETPLEDVLAYIRKESKHENEKGLQFYQDPASFQEADKTMTSPVTLDLENIPISTALSLMLKQLDLGYAVQSDGIVVIGLREGDQLVTDPNARILEEVAGLKREVRALRSELRKNRGKN